MAIRRDPFETMERMFDQMRQAGFAVEPRQALAHSGFDANVTLERDGEDVVVMADLPGFEREEIEVHYQDEELTITGTHEDGDGEAYRSRSVEETITIPADVDPEAITATYKNGVLEVWLPVAEAGDGYRIDIE